MHQTIVYVCAKFHKNRFNRKKVMADPIRVGGTWYMESAHGCLKVKVKYYDKNVLLRLKTLFNKYTMYERFTSKQKET